MSLFHSYIVLLCGILDALLSGVPSDKVVYSVPNYPDRAPFGPIFKMAANKTSRKRDVMVARTTRHHLSRAPMVSPSVVPDPNPNRA